MAKSSAIPYFTLHLDPSWEAQESYKFTTISKHLGDNYRQTLAPSNVHLEHTWTIKKTGLTKAEKNDLKAQIESFSGFIPFLWSPGQGYSLRVYRCKEFSFANENDLTSINKGLWTFEAVFIEDKESRHDEFLELISVNDINSMISGFQTFLSSSRGQSSTINLSGNLINTHGGIFSPRFQLTASGVSSTNFVTKDWRAREGIGRAFDLYKFIIASLNLYQATNSNYWRTLADNFSKTISDTNAIYTNGIPSQGDVILPGSYWWDRTDRAFELIADTYDYNGSNDPRYRYAEQDVQFNNGVGFVQNLPNSRGTILSRITRIYDPNSAGLLTPNLFSPAGISNEKILKNYVAGIAADTYSLRAFLTLDSFRINGDRPSYGLSANLGRIELNGNHTGILRVRFSYFAVSGSISYPFRSPICAYPFWRTPANNEIECSPKDLFLAFEAASKLNEEFTAGNKWQRMRDSVLAITQQVLNPQLSDLNETYFFRRSNTATYFDLPGQRLLFNNVTPTVSLLNNNAIQVAVPAQQADYKITFNSYGQEFQATSDSVLRIEAYTSRFAILQIVISFRKDADLEDRLYAAYILTNVSRNETGLETFFIPITAFRKWDPRKYCWYPLKDGYIWSLGVYTVPFNVEKPPTLRLGVDANNQIIYQVFFRKCLETTYIMMERPLGLARPSALPVIKLQVLDNPLILLVIDTNNYIWELPLPVMNEPLEMTISLKDLAWSPLNPSTNPPPKFERWATYGFRTEGQHIDASVILYWVKTRKAFENDPDDLADRLELPEIVRSLRISYSSTFTNSLNSIDIQLGDVELMNPSPESISLEYTPGVVPQFIRKRDGVYDWIGNPMTGHQDPYGLYQMGLIDEANRALDFLLDAQRDYARRSGDRLIAPFSPKYLWNNYVEGESYQGKANTWTWENGFDSNTDWVGYQLYPLLSVARLFYEDVGNEKAKEILTSWIQFLDDWNLANDTNRPATEYSEDGAIARRYQDPFASALILQIAIYANLSGLDVDRTFRLIVRAFRHMKNCQLHSGNMKGSLTANAPTVDPSNPNDQRELYSYELAEQMQAIALLLKYRNQLRVPPYGTPITSADF